MSDHVNSARSSMFAESCDEVKNRLIAMCENVERTMAAKADEVFLSMQRDYMEVISGTALPQGQMMPKWERKMRAEVAKVIEDREKVTLEPAERNAKAIAADVREAEAEDNDPRPEEASEAEKGKSDEDSEPYRDSESEPASGESSSPSIDDMDWS